MSALTPPMPPFGPASHNHARCVTDALRATMARCSDEGLRFTPVRRRVLEILLEEHRAMGAYEVLERLQSEGLGTQPPIAYRALDFLIAHGFAHRIERLNAFIACAHPGEEHVPAFLICSGCRLVAEMTAFPGAQVFETGARVGGFRIDNVMIEAEGCCAHCRERHVS